MLQRWRSTQRKTAYRYLTLLACHATAIAFFGAAARPVLSQEGSQKLDNQPRKLEQSEVPFYWFARAFLLEVSSRNKEGPERLGRFLAPYSIAVEQSAGIVLLAEAERATLRSRSAPVQRNTTENQHLAARKKELLHEATQAGASWARVLSAIESSGGDPLVFQNLVRQRLAVTMFYTEDFELVVLKEADRVFRSATQEFRNGSN
jgi:hypothetical protein